MGKKCQRTSGEDKTITIHTPIKVLLHDMKMQSGRYEKSSVYFENTVCCIMFGLTDNDAYVTLRKKNLKLGLLCNVILCGGNGAVLI